MNFFSSRRTLSALLTATFLAAGAAPGVAAPSEPTAAAVAESRIRLPARPSELLRAPVATWEPVLTQAAQLLDARAARAEQLDKQAQVELAIQRAVLSQARQQWTEVQDSIKQARQLQSSESGRQTAGLLNQVLARQAESGGDAAWLQDQLRDQVLAMPWAEVEGTVRTLRDQLAAARVESIEAFVANRLDVAASVSSNEASLGFVIQLLGTRFQLLEVMPRRDALVAGLDAAIAQRSEAK